MPEQCSHGVLYARQCRLINVPIASHPVGHAPPRVQHADERVRHHEADERLDQHNGVEDEAVGVRSEVATVTWRGVRKETTG